MRGQKRTRIRISVVIIITMLFMLGSALGAFVETEIEADERNGALLYVDSIIKNDTGDREPAAVFKEALKNNGILLLIMGIGGITVVLFPLAAAIILFKGAAIGFTSALIIDGGGSKGILESSLALLPQNMIIVPVLGIYGYFTICMAVDVIRCRNKRCKGRLYTDSIKVYLMVSAVSAAALCAAAGIEAYVNPVLTGII